MTRTAWTEYADRYRELAERELASVAELERLLLDRSELDAEVLEQEGLAYMAMTQCTDDACAKEDYLAFCRDVAAPSKEARAALDGKIVESSWSAALDPVRYGVLLRGMRANVELFRDEAPGIEAECAARLQEWSEIQGALSVECGGEALTMKEAQARLEAADRETREDVWLRVAEERAGAEASIDRAYDELVRLRTRLARNAGFEDYRGYAFVEKHRFDYGIDDCVAFHAAVEEHFVPLLAEVLEDRARRLRAASRRFEVASLRPWDLTADPDGSDPLRPCRDASELVSGVRRMFHRMDAELGGFFDSMRDGKSLDLESRPGKAPGGYQMTLDAQRRPFIFMHVGGINDDLRVLTHEAGHAFHTLLAARDPLLAYRVAGPEFSEVASMSMELLVHPYLDEFYAGGELRRSRRSHLEGIVRLMPWIAVIDAFQLWVYEHPEHSTLERADAWEALYRRFTPIVDWSGHERALRREWQRVPHLFTNPLHFIEYGIAQLGALQVWARAREDEGAALAAYKRALALGGSRTLPELFGAAGLELDFTGRTMEGAAAMVGEAWRSLA